MKRINAIRVTKAELVAFNEAVNQLPAADRSDFVSRALVAMEQHPGDHEKVSALMFRMEALARSREQR